MNYFMIIFEKNLIKKYTLFKNSLKNVIKSYNLSSKR